MKKIDLVFIVIFIVLFTTLGVSSIIQKSYTADEPRWIVQGYYYLTTGNSFNSHEPVFGNILSVLPLLFMNLDALPMADFGNLNRNSDKFFYYGSNDMESILFWARFISIIEGLIIILIIYLWANKLHGTKVAVIASSLFVFSPTVLANTRLVVLDIVTTLMILLTIYFLWLYLTRKNFVFLVFTGVFFGLLVATRTMWLFFVPILLLLLLLAFIYKKQTLKKSIKSFFIIVGIGLLVFSIVYIPEIHPLYSQDPFYAEDSRSIDRLDEVLEAKMVKHPYLIPIAKKMTTTIPLIAPHYIHGMATLAYKSIIDEGGIDSYMFGSVSSGWKSYYIVSYLLKTPLLYIVLALLAFSLFLSKKEYLSFNNLFLLIPIVIWFTLCSLSSFNAGIRLLLPIYPFLFLLIAINLRHLPNKILVLLLLLTLGGASIAYPNYISYYNVVGSNMESPFIEANFDWNQDIKSIGSYMSDNNISSIYTTINHFNVLGYYDINFSKLDNTSKGIAVISYSTVKRPRGDNLILKIKDCTPIDSIRKTLYIYNITK